MKQASAYCTHCEKRVLATAPTPNHGLHLALSIMSCGLWLFIWPLVAAASVGGYRCAKCGSEVEKLRR